MSRHHFCIRNHQLTPCIVADIRSLYIEHEIHLARTRFWLDMDDLTHLAFIFKYSDILECIDAENWDPL